MTRDIDFSRLWDGFATDKEAKQMRDKLFWALQKNGIACKRYVLRGQMKKYDGLGQPNGGICDVYCITIWDWDLNADAVVATRRAIREEMSGLSTPIIPRFNI